MEKLKKIAERWNWDNLDPNWTILEGAYCRLSWVLDGQPDIDEEYKNILQDTMDIIETLQEKVKTKL